MSLTPPPRLGCNEAPLLDRPGEVDRRRALLPHSSAAGLSGYVAGLRTRHGAVPDPDPLDGGTGARLLLLLETPGPAITRTGFVSADNPTGTGRNLRRFCAEAGLRRQDRLIWNTVPWIIHDGGRNRPPRAAEIREGLAELPALLRLLSLRVVVLSGRVAARAEDLIPAGVAVLTMPHPSPTITCTSPAIPARIRAALAQAAGLLGLGEL